MTRLAEQQHLDWLARSFGRPDHAPLGPADVELIRSIGEFVSKYPGTHLSKTHLFKEGEADAAFLVESGDVEIYRVSGRGRRVVSHLGNGIIQQTPSRRRTVAR